MREVRLVEADIVNFQHELRSNIQTTQMREYVTIGNETLNEFYKDWENKFQSFEDESLSKIQSLQLEHEEQMEMLNQKLDRAVEAAKIKPAARLKEMQNNEKLVAVNERIEEAMNYRGELKKFEVEEADRVEMLKQQNADNQRRKLLLGQVRNLTAPNRAEKRDGPGREQDRDRSPQPEDPDGQGPGCPPEADQPPRPRHRAHSGCRRHSRCQQGQDP